MTRDETLDVLIAAAQGLSYPSETDSPVAVLRVEELDFEELDFDDLFGPLLEADQDEDPEDGPAAAWRHLIALVQGHLTGVRCFRLGPDSAATLIVSGHAGDGKLIALRMESVET